MKMSLTLWRAWAIALGLVMAGPLAACGDDAAGDDDDDGQVRPRIPTTRGPWTTEFAVGDGAGREARAVWVPDAFSLGIAYIRSDPRDTTTVCEVGGVDPGMGSAIFERYFTLEYAYQQGSWRSETIADVLFTTIPPGIGIALDPASGQPVVASMTGVQALQACIASDVGLFRRTGPGNWSAPDIAAVTSADASVAGCEEPCSAARSDFGDVVGWWPTVEIDADGQPFIAYSDRHAGAIQSDDRRSADLEVAWGNGGGWRNVAVDASVGAGDHIQVAFDGTGAPVITYQNPVNFAGADNRQGLYVARYTGDGPRSCEGTGNCTCLDGWDCVRLRSGPNQQRQDVAVDPTDGTIRVVAYDPRDDIAKVWSLDDPSTFADASTWALETGIGDARFDEGREPSIAIDSQGRVGVAYYRCASATDGSGNCPFGDDGIVFTWRDTDGSWEAELVDDGPEIGVCGRNPSLVFEEDAGETTAHIAYLCQNLDDDGRLVDELWVAVRETL